MAADATATHEAAKLSGKQDEEFIEQMLKVWDKFHYELPKLCERLQEAIDRHARIHNDDSAQSPRPIFTPKVHRNTPRIQTPVTAQDFSPIDLKRASLKYTDDARLAQRRRRRSRSVGAIPLTYVNDRYGLADTVGTTTSPFVRDGSILPPVPPARLPGALVPPAVSSGRPATAAIRKTGTAAPDPEGDDIPHTSSDVLHHPAARAPSTRAIGQDDTAAGTTHTTNADTIPQATRNDPPSSDVSPTLPPVSSQRPIRSGVRAAHNPSSAGPAGQGRANQVVGPADDPIGSPPDAGSPPSSAIHPPEQELQPGDKAYMDQLADIPDNFSDSSDSSDSSADVASPPRDAARPPRQESPSGDPVMNQPEVAPTPSPGSSTANESDVAAGECAGAAKHTGHRGDGVTRENGGGDSGKGDGDEQGQDTGTESTSGQAALAEAEGPRPVHASDVVDTDKVSHSNDPRFNVPVSFALGGIPVFRPDVSHWEQFSRFADLIVSTCSSEGTGCAKFVRPEDSPAEIALRIDNGEQTWHDAQRFEVTLAGDGQFAHIRSKRWWGPPLRFPTRNMPTPAADADELQGQFQELEARFAKGTKHLARRVSSNREKARVPLTSPIVVHRDSLEETVGQLDGWHTPAIYETGGVGSPIPLTKRPFSAPTLHHVYHGRIIWLIIPAANNEQFERWLSESGLRPEHACPLWPSHSLRWVYLEALKEADIPFRLVSQEAGQSMLIEADAWYQGFGVGYSVSECCAYTPPGWRFPVPGRDDRSHHSSDGDDGGGACDLGRVVAALAQRGRSTVSETDELEEDTGLDEQGTLTPSDSRKRSRVPGDDGGTTNRNTKRIKAGALVTSVGFPGYHPLHAEADMSGLPAGTKKFVDGLRAKYEGSQDNRRKKYYLRLLEPFVNFLTMWHFPERLEEFVGVCIEKIRTADAVPEPVPSSDDRMVNNETSILVAATYFKRAEQATNSLYLTTVGIMLNLAAFYAEMNREVTGEDIELDRETRTRMARRSSRAAGSGDPSPQVVTSLKQAKITRVIRAIYPELHASDSLSKKFMSCRKKVEAAYLGGQKWQQLITAFGRNILFLITYEEDIKRMLERLTFEDLKAFILMMQKSCLREIKRATDEIGKYASYMTSRHLPPFAMP